MKNYNVYMFNDGDVLASTKSINYFRKELGAKQVASELTEDDAWYIQNRLLSDNTMWMMIYKLVNNVIA